MACGECCQRNPVTARASDTVRDAAKRMDTKGVGCVVVVDEEQRPVGMLTDRDVVVKVLRRRRDPDQTRVDEVMHEGVTVVRERMPVDIAFRFMRRDGVRRIPIVDDDGRVSGILSYDDALQLIAEQLGCAAAVARAQFPAAAVGSGAGATRG